MAEAATPRVAVVGGSGYTGRELLDRLARHSSVEVAWASSRSEAGEQALARGFEVGIEPQRLAEVLFGFLVVEAPQCRPARVFP